ncbi:permease [Xenorhabdus sp. Flor]|uniref:permease n=1 Tax=Xenorhabdus cabanillasii TaxID=351673 RepID=UPI0019BE1B4C|nr:permease [Xenorhabdus sp. Flor]MBD2813433.1 permease [Xenorhabdus sp. Flor]
MTIFLPLFYLLIGWLIGKTSWDIKVAISGLLTKFIIPIVIIFNISTHFNSMGGIIIVTALSMISLLGISRIFSRDPVTNLCFSYLNIGWLGLPVASTLFGDEASMIVISAYVGSSIIGNSIGAGLLSGRATDLKSIFKTPPIIALCIGIVLIPFEDEVQYVGEDIYKVAKFLMSFIGMAILGIWLSKIKISIQDFRNEISVFLVRSGVIAGLVTLLLFISFICDNKLITNNFSTLYLFCLLPPAANIIVLETRYLDSGRSARSISCGTCISIISIAIYAVFILGG